MDSGIRSPISYQSTLHGSRESLPVSESSEGSQVRLIPLENVASYTTTAPPQPVSQEEATGLSGRVVVSMNQAEVYEGGAVRLSPMRQKEANLVRYIKNVHNYSWPVRWGSEPITRLILELMNEIEHFSLEKRSDLLSDIISRMKSVSGESTSHSSEVSGLNDIIVRTLKSLLLAVKAEIELIEEVKKHKCFGGFDYNQLWRLVIDGEHQQKHGKYTFEGEEGYLAGGFQGALPYA